MVGAIVIAVILVIVLPVIFLVTGAVLAVIVGWSLNTSAKVTHEGSELVETNY